MQRKQHKKRGKSKRNPSPQEMKKAEYLTEYFLGVKDHILIYILLWKISMYKPENVFLLHLEYSQILLYCVSQITHFFQIEGTLCHACLLSSFFPIAFAHLMSWGHILVILVIFKTFKLLL